MVQKVNREKTGENPLRGDLLGPASFAKRDNRRIVKKTLIASSARGTSLDSQQAPPYLHRPQIPLPGNKRFHRRCNTLQTDWIIPEAWAGSSRKPVYKIRGHHLRSSYFGQTHIFVWGRACLTLTSVQKTTSLCRAKKKQFSN